MGASESIAAQGGLTHERLFQLTHDTRSVMNLILEYMIKEVTVKDFLALSNPTECKKYVLFMANALHRQFYELQVRPVREKGGVIAFRSLRDLAAPSPEEEREKQGLCLTLAYYYTRIFQIYGALALTLIDDISTMRQMGILTGGPGRGLVTPGQRAMIYGGSRDSSVQGAKGGALTAGDLGRFAFLLPFLKEERGQYGYRAKYVEQNGLDGAVYFKVKSGESGDATGSSSLAVPTLSGDKGVFTFYYEGAKNIAQIEIRVEKVATAATAATGTTSISSLYGSTPSSAIRVTFMNYRYVPRGETGFHTEEIPYTYMSKTLPSLYPVTTGNGQVVYAFRDTNRSLNEVLQDVMYRLMRYTKARVEEGRRLNQPPTGVRTGYGTLDTTGTGTGTGPSANVLKTLSTSEDNTVEPLRLAKILQNLQNTKPYGHCIARALQLLDSAPFPEQKEAVTHICKAKFLEVPGVSEKGTSTRYSRSGIPEPGVSLTTSPGLLALSQLFYDTIAAGTPKLEMTQQPGPGGKSTLQQYVEFMRRMATNFGDNIQAGSTQPRSDSELKMSGLSGIKNRRDQQFCKDYQGGDMTIPIGVAQQVYGIVQGLFQIQLEHSANCGKIFQMLFDIQREQGSGRVKIAIHPNVLQKGVAEVNRINYIARDLLMKYYTRCEEGYMRGVKVVVDHKRVQHAAVMAEAEKRTVVTAPVGVAPVPVGVAPTAPALRPAAPPAPPAPPALRPAAPPAPAPTKPTNTVTTFLKGIAAPAAPALRPAAAPAPAAPALRPAAPAAPALRPAAPAAVPLKSIAQGQANLNAMRAAKTAKAVRFMNGVKS